MEILAVALSALILAASIIVFLKAQKRDLQLRDRLAESEKERIRAETELQSVKDRLESEKDLVVKLKEQMQDSFKSLASTALEGNNRQFLDLAQSLLGKETQANKSEIENGRQKIESLVEPLKVILENYQTHVRQLEKDHQKSMGTVESELKKVVETSRLLSVETKALKNALKKPHVRGRWGEVQLKNCVELAGMSEFADVTFQDVTCSDGKKYIPDMTVRMPGGRRVVVDAKTPIDAFLDSLEASTEEEKATQMSRHGQIVKDHIKKLSSKAYHDELDESADFTVMFLPNESFLYAALETQADLVEYALNRKVLIATPPTLIGLLKVIRFGWNEERLAENAEKISVAGKELHKRVCDFMDAYMGIGKYLDYAKTQYDKGLSRLNTRVLVQARKMEKLGAKSKKDLPVGMGEAEHEEPRLLDESATHTMSVPTEDSETSTETQTDSSEERVSMAAKEALAAFEDDEEQRVQI